jgi:hypothetical protein
MRRVCILGAAGPSNSYRDHRACVEYWLGIAKGMGVRIELPDGCTLMKSPLYAYDEFIELGPLQLNSVEVLSG